MILTTGFQAKYEGKFIDLVSVWVEGNEKGAITFREVNGEVAVVDLSEVKNKNTIMLNDIESTILGDNFDKLVEAMEKNIKIKENEAIGNIYLTQSICLKPLILWDGDLEDSSEIVYSVLKEEIYNLKKELF